MNLTAKISREWRDRMIIVLLMLLGSSAWFFYDGAVAYPKYNIKADAYAELQRVYQADETLLKEKWKALAIENHWDPEDVPKKRKDEAQQFRWGSGLLVISVAFLLWMLREMHRVILADDEKFIGITRAVIPFNALREIRFDSVFGVDKRRWDKKGIAVVFYKTEKGGRASALIDEYKYAGSERLLERCEAIIEEKKARKASEAVPQDSK